MKTRFCLFFYVVVRATAQELLMPQECRYPEIRTLGDTLPSVLNIDPSHNDKTIINLPTIESHSDIQNMCALDLLQFDCEGCKQASGVTFDSRALQIEIDPNLIGQSYHLTIQASWPGRTAVAWSHSLTLTPANHNLDVFNHHGPELKNQEASMSAENQPRELAPQCYGNQITITQAQNPQICIQGVACTIDFTFVAESYNENYMSIHTAATYGNNVVTSYSSGVQGPSQYLNVYCASCVGSDSEWVNFVRPNGWQLCFSNIYSYFCATSAISLLSDMVATATYTIGNDPVTISDATFTPAADCDGVAVTMSWAVDGVQPTWISYSSGVFSVSTLDTQYAGDYTLIVTSYHSTMGTVTSTTVITLVDPCPSASLVMIAPLGGPTYSTTVLGQVLTEAGFEFEWDTGTDTQLDCGQIDYSLTPSQQFVTFTGTPEMIIESTDVADQGSHSCQIKASNSDYSKEALTQSFTIEILPCEITSLAPNYVPSTSPVTITIFDAPLVVQLASYTQSPACGYVPTESLTVQTIQGGSFSSLPEVWDFDGTSTTHGQVQSDDYTSDGQTYTLMQSTSYPGFSVPEEVEVDYTFSDPCTATKLQDRTIQDVDGFIQFEMTPLVVTLPELADTVSVLYPSGISTPSCFTQTIQVNIDGSPDTLGVLSEQIWSLTTDDTSLAGEHTVDVTFTLDRYPSIQTVIGFQMRLFSLIAPEETTVTQFYRINESELVFYVDLYQCVPQVEDISMTHTVTLFDGSELPSFIEAVEESFRMLLRVQSNADSDIGEYSLNLTGSIQRVSQETILLQASVPITLEIQPSLAGGLTVNKAPEFVVQPTQIFNAQVGAAWSYTLPEFSDNEGHNITLSVDLGTAVFFMTFDNTSALLEVEADATQGFPIMPYAIWVTLTDDFGKQNTEEIIFNLTDVPESNTLQSPNESQLRIVDNFDWLQAFIEARQKAEGGLHYAPSPKISKLSREGHLEIQFNTSMFVPPLEALRQATVSIDDVDYPALQLELIAGYFSDPRNLTFTYNITGYKPSLLSLQLNFDKHVYVSGYEDPDRLQVRFVGNQYFFSEYGQPVAQYTQLEKELPKQIKNIGLSKFIAFAGFTVTAGVTLNIALNQFVGFGIQQILSMIDSLQLVVFLPLMNVNTPANATMFFRLIMMIVAVDVIPTDSFYEDFTDMSETEPINQDFETIGYDSLFFLYNLGSLIVVFLIVLIYPLLALILNLISKFFCKFKSTKSCYQKLQSWKQQLMDSFYRNRITVFKEAYMVLMSSALINLRNLNFETSTDTVSTVLAFIAIALGVFLPIVFGAIVWAKSDDLDQGVQFEALNDGMVQSRGRALVLQVMHYYVRRLVMVVVIVAQDNLFLQIMTLVSSWTVQVMILGSVQPFYAKRMKTEYLNEIFFLVCLYHMMCFTELVPSLQMQAAIGWICVLLVSAYLLINFVKISSTNLKQCKLANKKLKQWSKVRRQKQIQQKQNQTTANEWQQQFSFWSSLTQEQKQTEMTIQGIDKAVTTSQPDAKTKKALDEFGFEQQVDAAADRERDRALAQAGVQPRSGQKLLKQSSPNAQIENPNRSVVHNNKRRKIIDPKPLDQTTFADVSILDIPMPQIDEIEEIQEKRQDVSSELDY